MEEKEKEGIESGGLRHFLSRVLCGGARDPITVGGSTGRCPQSRGVTHGEACLGIRTSATFEGPCLGSEFYLFATISMDIET